MANSAPLSSMTGYARGSGVAEGTSYSCEIKSVNARGLDIRLRLAPGIDAIEGELRRKVGAAVSRGSITLSINVEREGAAGEIVINEHALGAIIATMTRLEGMVEAQPPTLDGILALKGVIEQHEHALTAEQQEVLHAAIMGCVDVCLAELVSARRGEGERLAAILNGQVNEIERLTRLAEAHPSRARDVILERLRNQVSDLVAAGVGMSEERLAQEALLLATKADIREELDRLTAHIANARALITQGGPVGRKLDFLAQEFNRETNTLCSKSNAVDLTAIGLDLKAVIDQLREQVQNIE